MNVFQILGSLLLLALVVVTLAAALRRRMAWGPALFWLVLWLAAGAAILDPEITAVFARMLGISRGADLVFYCGILAMFAGFFVVYMKLRRVDKHLTVLVRQLAILEARQQGDEPGDRAPRTEDVPA